MKSITTLCEVNFSISDLFLPRSLLNWCLSLNLRDCVHLSMDQLWERKLGLMWCNGGKLQKLTLIESNLRPLTTLPQQAKEVWKNNLMTLLNDAKLNHTQEGFNQFKNVLSEVNPRRQLWLEIRIHYCN